MRSYDYVVYEYSTLDDVTGTEYYAGDSEVPSLADVYSEITGAQLPQISNYTNILWNKYIFPTYFDTIITYHEYVDNLTENSRRAHLAARKWIVKFMAKVFATENKYVPLIEKFEEMQDVLLDPVSSKSTVRFNDTPQVDYPTLSGVEYTSNINVQENVSDAGTPAVRLAEIKAAWENVYYEWMREFHGLFIMD